MAAHAEGSLHEDSKVEVARYEQLKLCKAPIGAVLAKAWLEPR